MIDLPIETRIRNHYQADSEEWLVEKGKVKEAKLLKEACEEIEKLRSANKKLEILALRESKKAYMRNREIDDKEKRFKDYEKQLIEKLESAIKGLEYIKGVVQ